MGLFKIEKPGIQNIIGRNVRMISFDYFGVRVKTSDYFPCGVNLISGCVVDLIENNNVGEFNLVG